jgi:MFS family permease
VSLVSASTILVFTCCGCNFAFGIYQALYESMSKQPGNPFTGKNPAEIDLIGTLSISLMTLGAPLVVQWSKRFSPRTVALVGSVLFSLALELASLGTQLWHFELTQGVMLGMGTCMCYMVPATVTPAWFTSHRGLAMGIVLSGTGLGGLVWAPALQASNAAIGFRNTLRWSGGICFCLLTCASFAMAWDGATRTRLLGERQQTRLKLSGLLNVPLVDWRVAKSRRFLASALGAIFQSAAYYTPIFFFAAYASTLGYSDRTSSNFIAINNACNAVGKIAIGYAADRVGRLNALCLSTFLSAAAALAFWFPSTLSSSPGISRSLFVAFNICYGLFASAYVSLFPTSLMELFGAQNFVSVNGFLYMVRGASAFVGTPAAGAFIRTTGSITKDANAYEGMALLVSALLVAATFSAAWVRVEASIGIPGTQKRGWNR